MLHKPQCLGGAGGFGMAGFMHDRVSSRGSPRAMPRRITSLGTDGFGRSEGRAALRDFFEVDAKSIVLATLVDLVRDGALDASVAQKAIADLDINPDKPNPARA